MGRTMDVSIRLMTYKDTVKILLLDPSDVGVFDGAKWGIYMKQGLLNISRKNGRETIYFHRAVLNIPRGDPRVVQHLNKNRFDNRRCNQEAMVLYNSS